MTYFHVFYLVSSAPTWRDIPRNSAVELDTSVELLCGLDNLTPNLLPGWRQTSVDPTRIVSQGPLVIGCDTCSITGDQNIGQYHLTINPVKRSDAGEWQCRVADAIPQYYSAYITIVEPANIITPPSDQTVNEDGSVTFECTATGVPDVTYTWQKDSTDIDIGGRYAVTDGSLTISNIVKSDYGTCTCIADNGVGSGDSKSAVLTVIFKPDSTSLSGYTGAVTGGSNILLTCTTTTSNPSATILWYRNNIRIYDNDDNINIGTLTETNGDYNGKISEQQITITTRAEDNQAEYKCKARNSQVTGDVNSNIVLITVYFKPDSASLSGYTGAVTSGSNILLTCTTATSNPSATILWYRNNNIIDDNNDNINIGSLTETNGDYNGKISEQQITITTRAEDNQAEYKCKARNSQVTGDVNSNIFTITVHYKPFVVNVLHNQWSVTSQGTVGKLRCDIESNPLSSVIWYDSNNQPVKIDSRVSIETVSRGFLYESILTIRDTMISDYGSYSCFAGNYLGNITFIVTFKDKSVPDAPKSIVPLTRFYDSLLVTIIPGYDGGDTNTTYFIQYRTPRNASFIELKTGISETTNSTIEILKLEPSTPYECRAYAANAIGIGPYSNSIIIRTL
uniref:Neural cell adhesion molecule 2-like n=1 Tax=Saccoglossus kowalevskii TaxID=10224 RepID=A0ABM0M469_SACKO